jgi:hypothetical protein
VGLNTAADSMIESVLVKAVNIVCPAEDLFAIDANLRPVATLHQNLLTVLSRNTENHILVA